MRCAALRAPRRAVCAAFLSGLFLLVAGASALPAQAGTLPAGFQNQTVFSGLTNPTAVRFAADGRVFVAQKNGIIKVFSSLTATTSTTFADLRTQVDDYWDRGLLGLEIDPQFPARPYIYVLYTYDAPLGRTAPVWNDACSDPTGNGCVVSGRLSRLTADGNTSSGEQALISDWCQQFPSHSIGSLAFGPDGYLYASGGDGASFNFADWGQQVGNLSPTQTGVANVCGDPTNEGGALRSQDLRTTSDPTTLDGSIIRIDPGTGAGAPGNPYASGDANAARIVAEGLRNPFRITFRPNTSEVWIGDVGWGNWEEINRMTAPATFRNFGWPCYEGNGQQSGYQALALCAALYGDTTATGATAPYYTYSHSAQVVSGESCPTANGSAITGLAFATSQTNYPAPYDTALFFADHSRNCIWAMLQGTNGLPDTSQRRTFEAGASNPVDLEIGPDGNLYYADMEGGAIRRIVWSVNRAPVASISASTTSGDAPLTVDFDGRGSSDPDGDALTYSWDLDGDGAFGDSTSATPSYTYTSSGQYVASLRVSDGRGGTGTDQVTILVGGGAPTATITAPAEGTLWAAGDVITFTGSATDPVDGNLPASALSWKLILHHCTTDLGSCHTHEIQSWTGVASGTFTAPDHEYPAYLELDLTATDSRGISTMVSRRLDPRTVQLTLASTPGGLQLVLDGETAKSQIVRTVIQNSTHTVGAFDQVIGKRSYQWVSWSDRQPATHTIKVTGNSKYTATFKKR